MGGKALEKYGAVRHDRASYERLYTEVRYILNTIFSRYREVPSFDTKQSFGDIDFIVEGTFPLDIEYILIAFGGLNTPYVHIKNSNMVSILYKNIQVDLIWCKQGSFENAVCYYSYGGFGHIAGKLAKVRGYRYTPEGLFENVISPYFEEQGKVIGSVCVSADARKCLSILNVKYSFKTQEGMFDRIMESSLFDPKIFMLKSASNKSKRSMLSSSTYMEFLKYISDQGPDVRSSQREDNTDITVDYDYEFLRDLTISTYVEQKRWLSLFNGKVVKANLKRHGYEVDGKDFGKVMEYLRACILINGYSIPEALDYRVCELLYQSSELLSFGVDLQRYKLKDYNE